MTPALPPALAHAFPRRAISARPSRRDLAVLAGSLLIGGGMLAFVGWFSAVYLPGLVDDPRIWREGETLVVDDIDGDCTRHEDWLPFADCSLAVTAHRAGAAPMTRRLEALTFFDIDDRAPAIVKADPRNPGRWTLSWYASEMPLRWAALATFVTCGMLLAGVIFGGAWALLRELRLYRALGRAPQPVLAEVVATRLVTSPDHAREITFRYRAAGQATARTAKQRLRVLKGRHGLAPAAWQYESLLPIGPGSNHVLALAGPAGARLVKASFLPLMLFPDEQRAVRDALAERPCQPP